jgi:hypothetical protein
MTDSIYVYYSSIPAFSYYAPQYKISTTDVILGVTSRENFNKYLKDIDQLKGHPRAWILFSHVREDEQTIILKHLNEIGMVLDINNSPGADLYLYDLSVQKP